MKIQHIYIIYIYISQSKCITKSQMGSTYVWCMSTKHLKTFPQQPRYYPVCKIWHSMHDDGYYTLLTSSLTYTSIFVFITSHVNAKVANFNIMNPASPCRHDHGLIRAITAHILLASGSSLFSHLSPASLLICRYRLCGRIYKVQKKIPKILLQITVI